MSGYQYSGSKDCKVRMYGQDNFLKPLYEKFGERFYKYRKDWDKAANGILPEYPLFLDVEPEYRCNLACITCPHQLGRKNPSFIADRMSVETYKSICAESKAYNLPSITVSNNNEGLIERHLFEYLNAAGDAGVMDIFLGTNAHFLNAEMSRKLLDSPLTRLLVSIDAATSETYRRMRNSDKFEQVIKNIHRFLELREKIGVSMPLLRVSMVVTRVNEHEQDAFKEMWQDYADIISMQTYLSPWGEPDCEDDLYPSARPALSSKFCSSLWQRMSIRANGDVIACCHLSNKLKVGNIHEKSIHEIWHGKAMVKLREKHVDGRYADIPVCRSCMA